MGVLVLLSNVHIGEFVRVLGVLACILLLLWFYVCGIVLGVL